MFRRVAATSSQVVPVATVAKSLAARRMCSAGGMPAGLYQSLATAKVGEPAPNFSCAAVHKGKIIDKVGLSNYAGKKICLVFYPLAFTFVCTTESNEFADRCAEFEKLNTQVLLCSVDSKFTLKAWADTPRKKGGVEGADAVPLLSDLTKDISRDYGVLIEEQGIALRGLFITDENHVLQHSTVNNLPIGRDVDEALRVIQAIDAAKGGKVAPCGWRPGAGKKSELIDTANAGEFWEKTY